MSGISLPADATKANMDASTDDPKLARTELADLVDKFNALLDEIGSNRLQWPIKLPSVAYASATSFTTSDTSQCHVGRMVQIVGSATGTVYGRITAVSGSTITIAEASLSNESISAWLSVNSALDTSIPWPLVDVRSYGVVGDGTTDDYAALSSVSDKDLLFPAGLTCVIGTDLTLSGNVRFEPGATVKPSSGKWVKFTGAVAETGVSILDGAAGGNVLITSNARHTYKDATYNVTASPTAPNDFSTVQAAIDAVPEYIAHAITIDIANGTWGALTVRNKRLTKSGQADFIIDGDTTTPSNVVVQGCAVRDVHGFLAPKFQGIEFSGGLGASGGNESVFIAVGCHRVSLDRCYVDGAGVGASPPAACGVLAYSSGVDLTDMVGIDNCGNQFFGKHTGTITVTNGTVPGTGITFPVPGTNGLHWMQKQIASAQGTSAFLDAATANKSSVSYLSMDRFIGSLHGPGFFFGMTTTIEDYFTSLDGYLDGSSGGGAVSIGNNGATFTTGGGTAYLRLVRNDLTAPSHLSRPIYMTLAIDIDTLPSGETIYIGSGEPTPSAGDFIGFKITSAGVDGLVSLGGTETTTNLFSGAVSGLLRLAFLYSPGTNDTFVESSPVHVASFFNAGQNKAVHQVMSGGFSTTTEMAYRFAARCAQNSSPVQFKVGGYRYVKM